MKACLSHVEETFSEIAKDMVGVLKDGKSLRSDPLGEHQAKWRCFTSDTLVEWRVSIKIAVDGFFETGRVGNRERTKRVWNTSKHGRYAHHSDQRWMPNFALVNDDPSTGGSGISEHSDRVTILRSEMPDHIREMLEEEDRREEKEREEKDHGLDDGEGFGSSRCSDDDLPSIESGSPE
jgi:hypothetical protein